MSDDASSADDPAPRVGLIGARRRRQGLGPFVARDLCGAGARVSAVLGTGSETVATATRELAKRYGVKARGYVDLDAMLARERLDALAILSPPETHEAFLEAALAAGLHVLCEKPLVWGGPRPAARAGALAEHFQARGLLLWENCQWPYTLPAFRALHPGALEGGVRAFSMRLSPDSAGAQMLVDSLPHPLSLLQTLAPGADARVEAPRFAGASPESSVRTTRLGIRFRYRAGGALVQAQVALEQSRSLPREAGYGVNGCWAQRRVRASDYAIRLLDGAREVDVPDPLGALVGGFVAELRAVAAGGRPEPADAIVQRMALLEELVRAYEGG